ncbi:MAG: hypothetical protein M1821_001121 [Bathelium mastoideum]|nr:MAG: hypothetical protein M1821_001121 [Bathelium mastoideum]
MAASNARFTRLPVHLLISALTILTLLPTTSAQQLLQYGANELPTCAQGCTLLNQAQSACVPPAAPVTNQATYQSCFCQSAYLRTLYTTPNGVCDAYCGQSDLVKIQQWYDGLCKSGAAATIPPSSSSSSAPATSSTSAVATVSPTTTPMPGLAQDQVNRSWISTHYQWVIFLIVLILAIAFFSFGGVWLKRRLKRRNAARREGTFNSTVTTATMPGSSGMAGPHPAMRSMDWAAAGAGAGGAGAGMMAGKPSNPSSSRVGTPGMETVGGAQGMRSVESGVGSTASGSGSASGSAGGIGKGKGQARVAEQEDESSGDSDVARAV